MRRILIVTYSKYGQTKKIARQIARKIEEESSDQCDFIYFDVEKDGNRDLPTLLDAVVIGSPIRFAKFPRKIEKWVHKHRFELAALRSSFFAVCLNAADPRPEAREAEMKILENFALKTQWEPSAYRIFAGALAYREYPFFLRLLMRKISQAHGGPTDTSRNHDLTDYQAVDAFASEINRDLEQRHHLKSALSHSIA